MSYLCPTARECSCGSGLIREAQYDAQNIFLAYTCDECYAERMDGYRPEILTGYTQADVDEPINEDC
jgi:hypothetical protein